MSTPEVTRSLIDEATTATTQAMHQVNGAAQRGLSGLQDRAQHLLDEARHAGERTADSIREQPLKSMLVAAAAGAALMALVGLLGRNRNRG